MINNHFFYDIIINKVFKKKESKTFVYFCKKYLWDYLGIVSTQ